MVHIRPEYRERVNRLLDEVSRNRDEPKRYEVRRVRADATAVRWHWLNPASNLDTLETIEREINFWRAGHASEPDAIASILKALALSHLAGEPVSLKAGK